MTMEIKIVLLSLLALIVNDFALFIEIPSVDWAHEYLWLKISHIFSQISSGAHQICQDFDQKIRAIPGNIETLAKPMINQLQQHYDKRVSKYWKLNAPASAAVEIKAIQANYLSKMPQIIEKYKSDVDKYIELCYDVAVKMGGQYARIDRKMHAANHAIGKYLDRFNPSEADNYIPNLCGTATLKTLYGRASKQPSNLYTQSIDEVGRIYSNALAKLKADMGAIELEINNKKAAAAKPFADNQRALTEHISDVEKFETSVSATIDDLTKLDEASLAEGDDDHFEDKLFNQLTAKFDEMRKKIDDQVQNAVDLVYFNSVLLSELQVDE